MKKPIPPDDLWQKIDEIYQKSITPDGCITIAMVAQKYEITYNVAVKIIAKMLKDGTIEYIGRTGERNSKTYREIK